MELEKLNNSSHRRYNILTGEWVLVSPHRTKRPWQGQEEELVKNSRPSYDQSCYLCPNNTRANGQKNPNYKDTFVFDNDFAAIQKEVSSKTYENGLLKAEPEKGICRVVCFSPDHSKSLANLPEPSIEKVIKVWQDQYGELGGLPDINYVQIFENKGSVMGCSNPHPHGQIWAHSSIPNEVVKKDLHQRQYYKLKNRSLLKDYMEQELQTKERIVYENTDFVILVPFWAVWPFEVMIVPKHSQNSILEMSDRQNKSFANAISIITRAYDKMFNVDFPYSCGIHQAPTDRMLSNHWHWHMSFYPPLLRSATVKKFMVGYEMFATPQRDFTPEYAANVITELIQ